MANIVFEEKRKIQAIAEGCYKKAKKKNSDFAEEVEFEQCMREKLGEIEKDEDELTNEIVGNELIGLFGAKNGGKIYVGEIGESVIDFDSKINATLVIEEDNTISWLLNPDERSDIGIVSLPVKPLEEMPDWWYANRAEDENERANRRAMRQNVEDAEGGW